MEEGQLSSSLGLAAGGGEVLKCAVTREQAALIRRDDSRCEARRRPRRDPCERIGAIDAEDRDHVRESDRREYKHAERGHEADVGPGRVEREGQELRGRRG